MICKERAYATINLDNIKNNVINIKKHIKNDASVMAIVKTDGYGHGAIRIARELDNMSEIGGFAVATIEEAMDLKRAGINSKILILGYCFPSGYDTLIRNHIRSTVFDYETAKELSDEAVKVGRNAIIHLKIDTGMSRIGMPANEDSIKLVRDIYNLPGITIEGIFTHFARADEKDKTYANIQLKKFKEFTEKLEEENIIIPVKHCSNSAAIIDMEDAGFDMVRAGIIIYGLWPSDEVNKNSIELYPAMEIKSSVVFVKEIEKGTQVSYGGLYEAKGPIKVATISIGYGDGYPRVLSNKGYVLIKGKKAPVLGRVCMDQIMVDVTNIPDVKRGDIATLIGKDNDMSITMEEFSRLANTINYESVCDIGKRVPRIYIKDGILET